MSGIAAIVRFDGRPADRVQLGAMMAAIEYRGVDGQAVWSDDQAALGHLVLHTTPESLAERQPLASPDGTLVLVMDGWLANPEELRAELVATGARLRDRSDAELVLHAFEQWGDACPRHIDGEYAFVVWDARRREVFCAKDHGGLRPLQYHWDGERLLVASDVAAILAAGDFTPRLDRTMMAQHLAFEFHTLDRTIWSGVRRVPPAQTMRVDAAGPHLAEYWRPRIEVSLRYPSDADYQAHYRAVFEDSVRRASRTHRPLACDVSGGHDSSAIFALAHRLLQDGRLQAPALRGYTYNFGVHRDPDIDELAYARDVAAHLGVELNEVAPFMTGLDWFAERGRADRDIPLHANAALAVNLGQTLVSDGCRVNLNGEGGDEFFAGFPYYYAEQIADRDWRLLAATLREDASALGTGQALRNLYRYGIGPALPEPVRALRRRFRRPPPGGHGHQLLTPDLRERLERVRRLDRYGSDVPNPARRSLLMTLRNGFSGFVRDFVARASARTGYEVRSPMYSRSMIEFAFSIPERQRLRGTVNKAIHLGAMRDDLPRSVLDRRDKSTFSLPFVEPLDKFRHDVLPSLLRCGIGWVNPAGLNDLWADYDRQIIVAKPNYPLWAVFGFGNLAEFW